MIDGDGELSVNSTQKHVYSSIKSQIPSELKSIIFFIILMCQPQNGDSATASNVTGLDVFKQLTGQVEVWQLNTAAVTVVLTFIFVQFRALIRSILWPELKRGAQRCNFNLFPIFEYANWPELCEHRCADWTIEWKEAAEDGGNQAEIQMAEAMEIFGKRKEGTTDGKNLPIKRLELEWKVKNIYL